MRSAVIGLALLLASVPAFGQSTAGLAAISGVVRDAAGAPVPNAQVVVSIGSQGATRRITTNSDGIFTAPALPPGSGYQVSITAAGFAPYDAKDMELRVGQNLNLNVTLT